MDRFIRRKTYFKDTTRYRDDTKNASLYDIRYAQATDRSDTDLPQTLQYEYTRYNYKPTMSSNWSTAQDGFCSNLFKQYGTSSHPDLLGRLDREVYNYEQNRESKIADQDMQIEKLKIELESTKEKLKRLQESRFKSRERELAVADSTLAEMYDSLIGDIKGIVLGFTRSVDGNVSNLIKLMAKSTQYQEGLKRVLEPNLSVQQFVEIMEKSKSPNNLLAFVLRAIILHTLRRGLFNANTFRCIGGDYTKPLRAFYRDLLEGEGSSHGDEPEILPERGQDKLRKDASLWRHNTLSALDKNTSRLGLKEKRAVVLQAIASNIEGLLAPLVGANADAKASLKGDLSNLVNFAAEFSIKLGKQRAMFTLETKNYLGVSYRRSVMEACGPSAADIDGDGEDQKSSKTPYDVVAVVVPALFKFGNDDGEEFENSRILTQAQVLVIPTSASEMPEPQPSGNSVATPAEKGDSSTSAPTNPSSSTQSSDEIAPKSGGIEPPPVATEGQNNSQTPTGEQDEAGPKVPPKDEKEPEKPPVDDAIAKDTQKVLSSEMAIETHKTIANNQKANVSAIQKPIDAAAEKPSKKRGRP